MYAVHNLRCPGFYSKGQLYDSRPAVQSYGMQSPSYINEPQAPRKSVEKLDQVDATDENNLRQEFRIGQKWTKIEFLWLPRWWIETGTKPRRMITVPTYVEIRRNIVDAGGIEIVTDNVVYHRQQR